MPTIHKKAQTKILYGQSGASKTTQLYYFAKWYWKNHQKAIRLITCNGGGWLPFEDSGMVDEGIVQTLDLTTLLADSESKLAAMRRLAQGYWPVLSPSGRGNMQNGQYFFLPQDECRTIEKENIGCYMFEDMASLARLLLGHLSEKKEGTGFKHSYKIEEEELSIGGLQEGHYGLVQSEIHKLVTLGFNTLPIDYFLMTSLVGEGIDKRERTKMFGPQMIGSAATAEIPSWFGDTWYLREMPIILEDSEGRQTASSQRVMYIQDYLPDADSIPYKTNLRLMPECVPQVLAKYPEGYVTLSPERGIVPFLNFLERIKREQREKLASRPEPNN
jgi:hypothetical protein